MRLPLIALMLCCLPFRGQADQAGVFDYYVLALSWTPSWCVAEGDARGSDQCAPDQGFGFTLHGLWPQYLRGWPSFCRTGQRDPSRSQTAAMSDIMGSGGLAWHQWKKHGRCTGLTSQAYFNASRRAYDAVERPQVLRKLSRDLRIPPQVIEAAFLETNPELQADGITVTCRDGRLHEIRICLDKDLAPRDCEPDVRRDCRANSVLVSPIR